MQAQYVLFFTVNGNWQGKFNLPLSSSPLSVVLVLQLGNLPRIEYDTDSTNSYCIETFSEIMYILVSNKAKLSIGNTDSVVINLANISSSQIKCNWTKLYSYQKLVFTCKMPCIKLMHIGF